MLLYVMCQGSENYTELRYRKEVLCQVWKASIQKIQDWVIQMNVLQSFHI